MKINLSQIKLPKSFLEKVETETKQARQSLITNLVSKGIAKEEAETMANAQYPVEPFNAVKTFEDSIGSAIGQWLMNKHFSKEKNTIVAPWDVRKKIGKIQNKLIESDDGKIDLSEEQLDFLIEVLSSDLSASSYFFFLGEYLENLKLVSVAQKN